MRIVVDFQDEGLELELPEERIVVAWRGPRGVDASQEMTAIEAALENPHDFPALRRMVVPGDRVAIAFDPAVPRAGPVLDALLQVFQEAGVGPENVTVLATSTAAEVADVCGRSGSRYQVHDPGNGSELAYLATTRSGRRIYLNRLLTDADVVVPVGRIAHRVDRGHRGPWSVLFPDLSDRDTIRADGDPGFDPAGTAALARARARLEQSLEVSWLLGTQFHIGILSGSDGLLEVIAGRDTSVRDQGIASLERHWTFHAPARAELVVAGVGQPETSATLEDLARALATATRLVQHGGKIVLLSRASGPVGPSLRRLIDVDDPRRAVEALRGHEPDEDHALARRLAGALAWADLFLLSALEPQLVESLSIVPLDRPEQARRLVENSGSASFVSHAELARVEIDSNPEG